ncbi:phosphatidate cytidylyltransferase [Marinomonas balearica]|uniref:Phosphatidate cytidylyltransferase n=1 Tax=Marinomonas balearica TaxID=491947 RepID=A0A4R6M715_9GAMM|nr:phosphatidate cytidylyltransferase [Marinomonas balearica]TDO96390.1 phosphatidate cytidylyltransferase [Marinomonas balearica]
MLLPRVLSAIVMAFFFISAVFFLPQSAFLISMAAVVVLAAWEWARLSGVKAQLQRVLFSAGVAVAILALYVIGMTKTILLVAPIVWLVGFLWVVNFPRPMGWQSSSIRLIFGVYILISTWAALAVLKSSPDFVVWILLLMGLIWGADSGAYFSGKAFGKRKLAPNVSPGKSWEGVIGGVVFTQIGMLLFSIVSGFSVKQALTMALIALLTVFVSVLGDLSESMFKRHESMKDSSNLIPGHGGVMDRVDSLTSAAPIFVLLLSMSEWL